DEGRNADVAHELEAPVVEPLGVGDLEEAAAADGAGVVDEDVDTAARAPDLVHDALDLREPREIGADRHRLPLAAVARLAGQLVERGLVAGYRHHARALARHAQRDRAADATAGARHHHDLVGQLQVHTLSSLSLASRHGNGGGAADGTRADAAAVARAKPSKSRAPSRCPRRRVAPSIRSERAPATLSLARCCQPTAAWITPCNASRVSPLAAIQCGSSHSCTSKY